MDETRRGDGGIIRPKLIDDDPERSAVRQIVGDESRRMEAGVTVMFCLHIRCRHQQRIEALWDPRASPRENCSRLGLIILRDSTVLWARVERK